SAPPRRAPPPRAAGAPAPPPPPHFPARDDEQWFKHTLAYRGDDGPRLTYSAVNMAPRHREAYPPEERKY
ncbi:MAG: hypothetical protein OXP08_12990, partial [bacterium]|nr:hypothetical protein [bacterium]